MMVRYRGLGLLLLLCASFLSRAATRRVKRRDVSRGVSWVVPHLHAYTDNLPDLPVRILALDFPHYSALHALLSEFNSPLASIVGVFSHNSSLCREHSGRGSREVASYCLPDASASALLDTAALPQLQPFRYGVVVDDDGGGYDVPPASVNVIVRFALYFKRLNPGGLYVIRLPSAAFESPFIAGMAEGILCNRSMPDVYYDSEYELDDAVMPMEFFFNLMNVLNQYAGSRHLRSVKLNMVYLFRWVQSVSIGSGVIVVNKRFTARSVGVGPDSDVDYHEQQQQQQCTDSGAGAGTCSSASPAGGPQAARSSGSKKHSKERNKRSNIANVETVPNQRETHNSDAGASTLGGWQPLQSSDGTGHDLLHAEPMAAVVDGDVSCVIVRAVLTPQECLNALERLEQTEILVDGKEGKTQVHSHAYAHNSFYICYMYYMFIAI
jgi:hypothetical protein